MPMMIAVIMMFAAIAVTAPPLPVPAVIAVSATSVFPVRFSVNHSRTVIDRRRWAVVLGRGRGVEGRGHVHRGRNANADAHVDIGLRRGGRQRRQRHAGEQGHYLERHVQPSLPYTRQAYLVARHFSSRSIPDAP